MELHHYWRMLLKFQSTTDTNRPPEVYKGPQNIPKISTSLTREREGFGISGVLGSILKIRHDLTPVVYKGLGNIPKISTSLTRERGESGISLGSWVQFSQDNHILTQIIPTADHYPTTKCPLPVLSSANSKIRSKIR